MALNPFFLQGSSNEQFLVQDLINEQLKIYGIDVYYIPRKYIKTDNILNEVESSKFDDNFIIEAYLNNYDGYSPDSDIMTKFGLRLKNEINLIISRERFEDFIVPLLEGIKKGIENTSRPDYTLEVTTRPAEGDLIYFPLGQRLFEIKKVEHERPFYQLGKNYVYDLQCELYEYENEDIETSIEEIDKTVDSEGYLTSLRLVGIGVTATATASIGNGVIQEIVLINDGSFYSSIPTVTISESPSGNALDNAKAVAFTTSIGGMRSVESIRLTFGGRGYDASNPPTVTITGGNGTGATATAIVADGGVNQIESIYPIEVGTYYYKEPTITISGPSIGQTATARALFDAGRGVITDIQIVNSGYGYTQTPTVQISSNSSVSIGGTYTFNETITGSLSGVTAKIKQINVRDDIDINNPPIDVVVSGNSGQFSPGELIVGSASSASYILKSYDNDNYEGDYEKNYDDNLEFEVEADKILDFTETNPFGEY